MKVIRIVLLTLTVFSQPGRSILCYFCPEEMFSAECTEKKNCTGDFNMCKTTLVSPHEGYPFQGNEVVIRTCAKSSSCMNDDPDSLGDPEIVMCCNNDLCNNRGINITTLFIDFYSSAQSVVATRSLLLGIAVPLIAMWL